MGAPAICYCHISGKADRPGDGQDTFHSKRCSLSSGCPKDSACTMKGQSVEHRLERLTRAHVRGVGQAARGHRRRQPQRPQRLPAPQHRRQHRSRPARCEIHGKPAPGR
eukprot:2954329-Pleurochrysis_carterae.AAC.3